MSCNFVSRIFAYFADLDDRRYWNALARALKFRVGREAWEILHWGTGNFITGLKQMCYEFKTGLQADPTFWQNLSVWDRIWLPNL